jgi:hypothetical protein
MIFYCPHLSNRMHDPSSSSISRLGERQAKDPGDLRNNFNFNYGAISDRFFGPWELLLVVDLFWTDGGDHLKS